MKRHHATIGLAIVFFTGLIVLWWADPTGIDPKSGDTDVVLPTLAKTAPGAIRRLEIERPKAGAKSSVDRIVLERRDNGLWQMLAPLNAAADPSMSETLVRNLIALRRSTDAGTIHDPPGKFGLAPPESIVRVYGADLKVPMAVLEVGKSNRDSLYVRPEGGLGSRWSSPSS